MMDLEAEAIEIIREAQATARNPVMMYSIGKDSSVMLHLARKAFWPAPVPFPLLHIDTGWKFEAMIRFRDELTAQRDVKVIVHRNEEGVRQGINPFDQGSERYTELMKTVALKEALDRHQFDFVLGGARRDEEKSRAKERIFSFRSAGHRWEPKTQRPELWNLYNTRLSPGESMRVFPLSNWTESDIWHYIKTNDIPVVDLYFSRPRPVVRRGDHWIMVDDDRFPLNPGESPELRSVRFRTLGCYPLTAATESTATTLDEIVRETLEARTSEREGRLIDFDGAASMERKKQEGYF